MKTPFTVEDIEIDPQQDILMTGYFYDSADFDPGAGVHLGRFGGIFVCKWDKDLNFKWLYTPTGSFTGYGQSIETDKSGSVFLSGSFQGSIDLDPGPGTTLWTSTDDINDLHASFVARLSSEGALEWGKIVTDSGGSYISKLLLDDSANVYTTGSFWGTADLDPGPGTVRFSTSSQWIGYVCKWDQNANFLWVRLLTGASPAIDDFTLDGAGNIIATGLFDDSVNYVSPAKIVEMLQGDNLYRDQFILKLSRAGELDWFINAGKRAYRWYPHYGKVTVDEAGYIYCTGGFYDTTDFDPGLGIQMLTAKGGNTQYDGDIYISCLHPDGSLAWVKSFGTTGQNECIDDFMFDKDGNMVVTGMFADTIDIDPGSSVYNLVGPEYDARFNDAYMLIAKFGICSGPVSRISVSECDSLVYNGYSRSRSGSYYQRFPRPFACDSTSIIDLTITRPDTALARYGNYLVAMTSADSYQWLDCDDAMNPIPGATNIFFLAPKTGNYSLRITKNGCTAVSSCWQVIPTEVEDHRPQAFRCYPNPTNNIVTIDFGEKLNSIKAVVQDLTGRTLSTTHSYNTDKMDLSLDGPGGVYFINIITADGINKVLKVTKSAGR